MAGLPPDMVWRPTIAVPQACSCSAVYSHMGQQSPAELGWDHFWHCDSQEAPTVVQCSWTQFLAENNHLRRCITPKLLRIYQQVPTQTTEFLYIFYFSRLYIHNIAHFYRLSHRKTQKREGLLLLSRFSLSQDRSKALVWSGPGSSGFWEETLGLPRSARELQWHLEGGQQSLRALLQDAPPQAAQCSAFPISKPSHISSCASVLWV